MIDFSELRLTAPLQRALNEIGYVTMTSVQAASLPAVLAGRDVVAQAATGSGKTAVFALGLLSVLDASAVRLQGLVLCPTRELANQVSREIRRLARFIPNVKVLTLCGGIPLRPHLASLAHEPHIVVGVRLQRERILGFEPIETPTQATTTQTTGGVKGKRKSKKDKAREARGGE